MPDDSNSIRSALAWCALAAGLAFFAAAGCRPPHQKHVNYASAEKVSVSLVGEKHPALPPDTRIDIYTPETLPPGLDVLAGELKIAPHWPTEDEPHVVVGNIYVTQQVPESRDVDELKKHGKLAGIREQAAMREALAHGANALFRSRKAGWTVPADNPWARGKDLKQRGAETTAHFVALRLSDAPGSYPTVDELITRLKLDPTATIVQRKEITLEQLAETKLNLKLVRGHCYSLALVFRPGEVDRRQSPEMYFKTTLDHPLKVSGSGAIESIVGYFDGYTDNPGDEVKRHQLDGAWSRAGGGKIDCPVVKDDTATLSFGRRYNESTSNPLDAGTGPAVLVVFDQVLSPKKKAWGFCSRCAWAVEKCDRKKLDKCDALRQCAASVGVSLNTCKPFFAPGAR